tara:strand:- start:1080 stop:1238 length:159 start_codon:yes stop_codon:yes gene_type:complete
MKERVTATVDKNILKEFKARAEFETRNISNLTEIAMAEYLGNRSSENWKVVK